jgi:ABC-2 type transport system ATP-binding protein
LKGLDEKTARIRLKDWFRKFDILSWWDKKLEELSKGMQQKVQFIITVIHEPELLIFDEPFSGFDPVNAELLKNEILELKAKGKTIIFSTHNMASIEEICDEIALINRSKVVLSGNVNEIRSRYKTGIFQVQIAGDKLNINSGYYTLVDEKINYQSICRKIKKTRDMSNSELLAALAQSNEILAFEEEIPTMNDIFIRTVTQQENHE